VAPLEDTYLPPSQLEQEVDDWLAWYLPAEQEVQKVEAALDE